MRWLFFIFAFPLWVFAAPLVGVEKFVAYDIQALLDDTVNEGDQTARVIYEGEEPKVSCRLSRHRVDPKLKWAFCKVQFTVQFEEDSTERECNLLYSFDPAQPGESLSRGREDLFDTCMENLSEGL